MTERDVNRLYETYMTPDQARRVAATVLGSDIFAPASVQSAARIREQGKEQRA